jgi:Bacterial Ig domain/Divergent InlB B-repeat domain
MCPATDFQVKCRALVLVLFSALATLPAMAQSVMLGWQPSPNPNVAGYNLYYGTTSHIYTSKVSVGNVTNATISGLIINGNTYYFVATSYDSANQESGFSNEAVYAGPTNTQPTLNNLSSVTINENGGAQTVALSGISSGAANENQTLTVTASSNNPGLIPNPTVTYTSPNTTGSIVFTPVLNAFGTATISVTVNDGGASNNTITRTFTVTVNHLNQQPTLTAIGGVTINENGGAQTVALSGISSGAANENQTLTVTASSGNLNLIPNPTVTYTSPNTTGSIVFTPVLNAFGTAIISVTVNDGGASNNTITRTFTVTVNHINQPPTLTNLNNVVVNENAGAQTIVLAGISSGASNENQTLTVTASSGNLNLIPNPTVTYTSPNTTGSLTFTPVAKTYGTVAISVTVNDGGTSNNVVTRTFNVTVNHVNQQPTLTALSDVVINENAPAQTVALSGISSGAPNEHQTLTVTAISSNPGLIPNPMVTYTSPNTTGSLTFKPVARTFGVALISVTVNDGGTSNNIITRMFSVTVQTNDQTKPSLSILSPSAGQRWKDGTVAVKGTASDDISVQNVFYSLNGAPWINATTTSNWKTWTGLLSLKPGTNTLRAYAVDTSGNLSPTNTVTCEYDQLMPLSVQAFGLGTSNPGWGSFRPNYSKQTLLPVNESSVLTAQAAQGFAFVNWTDGSGNLLASSPTLSFIMTSNLVLQANFADVTRPTLSIVIPASNQQWVGGTLTVAGNAGDNVALEKVYYSLNGSDWTAATTENNWKKWTADVTLIRGTNTVQAYAVDTSGNFSITNTVKFEDVASPSLALAQSSTRALVRPAQAVLVPAYFADGQFALTVSGATNVQCVLLASTNLLDWIPVQTNIPPYTYLDTNAGQFSQRYYRTVGK